MSAFATWLLTWLLAASAHAGNEEEFFVGNHAAMVGGAVVATVADGSAAYYNPAGLGAVERSSADVSASVYALRFYRVPRFLQGPNGASEGASVTEFVAVPTLIAYVRHLADGVSLGLGYYAPHSSDVVLRERLRVDRDGTTSTWALDLRSSSESFYLTAGIGVRLRPGLRVGVALHGIYDAEIDSASLFGSAENAARALSAVQLSILGTYSRVSTEVGVGVQWDVGPAVTLATSVRGPRLQIVRTGEDAVSNINIDANEESAIGFGVLSDRFPEQGDQLGFLHLGRYNIGMAYRYGAGELTVEADLAPLLKSERTDVDRRWTWNARAGVLHRMREGLSLGFGLFTDRAIEASEGGALPVDFYGGTLGFELDDVLGLATEERADSLVLTTTFAIRYAYGFGDEAGLVLSGARDLTDFLTLATVDVAVHELALHVGGGLQF